MIRALTKRNLSKLLSITCLILIVSAVAIYPQEASAQTNSYFNKHFEWDYKGHHWTWDVSIPAQLYYAYKNVPVSNRTQDGIAGYGYCTTTQDSYIQSLAKELNDTANQIGYNDFDKASLTLAFVQSIPYTSDLKTTGYDEYPRFPIETLVDNGGDCDCKSILFATLTIILGFQAVFINPPEHMAVGILGNNFKGTFWVYPEGPNQTYYYSETTESGFMIGELPFQYTGQNVNIYSIDASKQFVPQSGFASPMISQPTSEQVLPQLSMSIVYDNPLLYALGLFAIVVAAGFVFTSIRKPKFMPIKTIPPTAKAAQPNQVDLDKS